MLSLCPPLLWGLKSELSHPQSRAERRGLRGLRQPAPRPPSGGRSLQGSWFLLSVTLGPPGPAVESVRSGLGGGGPAGAAAAWRAPQRPPMAFRGMVLPLGCPAADGGELVCPPPRTAALRAVGASLSPKPASLFHIQSQAGRTPHARRLPHAHCPFPAEMPAFPFTPPSSWMSWALSLVRLGDSQPPTCWGGGHQLGEQPVSPAAPPFGAGNARRPRERLMRSPPAPATRPHPPLCPQVDTSLPGARPGLSQTPGG